MKIVGIGVGAFKDKVSGNRSRLLKMSGVGGKVYRLHGPGYFYSSSNPGYFDRLCDSIPSPLRICTPRKIDLLSTPCYTIIGHRRLHYFLSLKVYNELYLCGYDDVEVTEYALSIWHLPQPKFPMSTK